MHALQLPRLHPLAKLAAGVLVKQDPVVVDNGHRCKISIHLALNWAVKLLVTADR